jgi:hypothetical protein
MQQDEDKESACKKSEALNFYHNGEVMKDDEFKENIDHYDINGPCIQYEERKFNEKNIKLITNCSSKQYRNVSSLALDIEE